MAKPKEGSAKEEKSESPKKEKKEMSSGCSKLPNPAMQKACEAKKGK